MDCTTRLPPELLGAVFGHLEQPDVLRAAAVCGRWREEALHCHDYYQCIQYGTGPQFYWHRSGFQRDMPVIAEAKRFSRAMHEAADNEGTSRLSVVICIAFRDVGEDAEWITDFHQWDAGYDVNERNPEYDDLKDVVRALILPSLTKCMKKICRLDIDVPVTYFETLSPGLCQPAPLLERFRLEGCPDCNIHRGTYDIRPSHELFGGHAPLLTNASFYGNEGEITLDTPVPAFARVVRVSLEVDIDIHLATLPRLFPSVRHLELYLHPSLLSEGDYETLGRQLHTLSASIHLYGEDQANDIRAFLAAMLPLETIHVDLRGHTGENLVLVFEHMRDMPSLCATLTEVVHNAAPCYEICIHSAASWTRQRVVRISKEMVLSCIADLLILNATITQLHLPHEFLRPCLQFTALLPSLATLHIGARRSRVYPRSEFVIFDIGPMPGFGVGDADDRSRTALWPALALVRVHVQGASSIRVQNDNLLAFLKCMKVPSGRQGSATPVLEISGPIVISGDGHETSLIAPLAELFSDVHFTSTARGGPSFEVQNDLPLLSANFQLRSTMQYAV